MPVTFRQTARTRSLWLRPSPLKIVQFSDDEGPPKMSAPTFDHTISEAAVEGHDGDVVDVTAWLDHTANQRSTSTPGYVPRHRADGPAP